MPLTESQVKNLLTDTVKWWYDFADPSSLRTGTAVEPDQAGSFGPYDPVTQNYLILPSPGSTDVAFVDGPSGARGAREFAANEFSARSKFADDSDDFDGNPFVQFMWVYYTALPTGGNLSTFIAKNGGASAAVGGWDITVNSAGDAVLSLNTGTGTVTSAVDASITAGQWHLVQMISPLANITSLRVDSTDGSPAVVSGTPFVNAGSVTLNSKSVVLTNAIAGLRLGPMARFSLTAEFLSNIGDVRAWLTNAGVGRLWSEVVASFGTGSRRPMFMINPDLIDEEEYLRG